ncbi:cytochrome P450 [Artomyces pyxidatus]|uniref:Cytochrome P450 n=1 Tax=Artomyces pyxidatus TaxID=48021 RepID=A0ACB8T8G3_9AGAM|nr:cytochrome P450 [Artomyces pyxidatus]
MAFVHFTVLDLVALAGALVLVLVINNRRKRHGLPYPPGPRGFPIIGNMFDLPNDRFWLTYESWAKVYGDIMSLQVLGQVIVIVQSPRTTRDLLEKRGNIYSDRPALPFYELAKWGWLLPTARADKQWRTGRRHVERGLRPTIAVQYRPMQKVKAHEFLKRLQSHPEDLRKHIEHLQGAIIMSVVYGYDVKEHDDEYVEAARAFGYMTQRTVLPGALLVNDFPFLKYLPEWLPGTGFKAIARRCVDLGEQVLNAPMALVKEAMENGTARPSMAREDLRECNSAEEERAIATAMASLYSAGADTTVSALYSFFLALVLYPSVQERAQAEVDRVTKGKRLPDYDDRPRLPYIDAICKEILRWRMVTPLGLPHASTEDDVYDGYFIPKGSLIIANAWTILHDPELYPDPHTFKPERFLTEDGQVKEDIILSSAFGFGKRICPGRHLVDSTLFIVVAFVLSTFNVGNATDAQGRAIPVEDKYTGTLVSHPEPFQCSIVPRSRNALDLASAPVVVDY